MSRTPDLPGSHLPGSHLPGSHLPDPAQLERWVDVLVAVVTRLEECADEAEQRWPRGVWQGQARDAYGVVVGEQGQLFRERAAVWRRVATELWGLADAVRGWQRQAVTPDQTAQQTAQQMAELDRVAGVLVAAALARPPRSLQEPLPLEGRSAQERDRINRAAVRHDLVAGRTRHDDGLLDGDEHVARDNARHVQRALGAVDESNLWLYDPEAFDGDGRVVIGVGDVDGADDLVVLVPGVGTETADAPGQVRRVEAMVEAARRHGSQDPAGFFWLGYDTPDGPLDPAMRDTARAEVGGDALAADLVALQESVTDEERWTVAGHSYGATVASLAATGEGIDVDAVVMVGSAGAGEARTADELGVGHVFVGRDSRDLVATLGDEGWLSKQWRGKEWIGQEWLGEDGVGLGVDPASAEFGAVRFGAERVDREPVLGLGEAHSGYFTRGNESLESIGAVVAGRLDQVRVAPHAEDPWWRRPRDPEWSRRLD